MDTNKNIEKAYELLEKSEFNELSEPDKIYILSVMSEKEYSNMRDTIKDTATVFANETELPYYDSLQTLLMDKIQNENVFIKFLKYPIQLYKVAASITLVLGLSSLIHFYYPHEKNSLMASHDTIIKLKTENNYSRLVDTIRIIETKTVFIAQKTDSIIPGKLLSGSKNEYDCNKEICPNDVDKIKELAFNNNVSSDSLLKNFIVSVR